MIKFILILLIILAGIYAYIYISAFIKNRNNLNKNSWWKFILIGLVTDIGDTIGIGNFAPTASIFKIGNLVEDRLIPGTMNAAHCLPVVTEALIFITVIKVEPVTLVTMLAAAIAGAVIGASIVSKMNVKAAMGITIGGIIGILIAAYIIRSLPLTILKWVILCVLVYTAIDMFKSGLKKSAEIVHAQ